LGQKLSEQSYSSEERHLLETLSNQMAMALENARLYEVERAMREHLEKQNEMKTEFLHNVAHELRTPLTAIISSSELLGEELSVDHKHRKRLIQNIRQGASSMNRRVTELLNLASLQVGELKIETEPVAIDQLIKEVVQQLEVVFESKKQTLRLEMANSLPQTTGDKGRLEQILFNLLSNANKFSPTGSKIALRIREVNSNIIVEVEDVAPTVTEEEKAKLFDPYYRGEDAEKRNQFPGLGLGLAIAKKIVELHQGKIWIESKKTKGNIFAFSLPVSKLKTNGVR
jgi:signal transduction histidine kinase